MHESWAPVVVGDPILEFEPKPSMLRPYQADTVFDGWSTSRFTVRMASVRGYSHRYAGTPRQDDAEVAFHEATGAVVFAVADGVSGASESHIGAAAACQASVDSVLQQLSSGRGIDWDRVAAAAADELHAWGAYLLNEETVQPEVVAERLATTLVAGLVVPAGRDNVTFMIQIGDSGAWVLRRGKYHPALAGKHDPRAEVISSAVDPLPRIPGQLRPTEFRLPPDAVLLVGTDGFGDPLGDGDGKLGRLFAEHLATPPPARGFAHLLDFSRETFDDDRTLVAVWPRPAQTAAARSM